MIFKNTLTDCPRCGASLNWHSKKCKYCDFDLVAYHEKNTSGNQTDHTSGKPKEKVKNKKKKIAIIMLFIIMGIIGIMIMASIVSEAVIENEMQQRQEELDKLFYQNVDTIDINPIPEEDLKEFVTTEHKSLAGEMEQNEKYVKIHMFADTYTDSPKYKIELIFEKAILGEVIDYEEEYIRITDGIGSVTIEAHNTEYYSCTVDTLNLMVGNVENVKRLSNIKIDDIIFEVYKLERSYYFVTNPNPNMFVSYEIRFYDNKMQNEETDVECLNILRAIKIEKI